MVNMSFIYQILTPKSCDATGCYNIEIYIVYSSVTKNKIYSAKMSKVRLYLKNYKYWY